MSLNLVVALIVLALATFTMVGEGFKIYWLAEAAALCSGIFCIVVLLWFAVALLWWCIGPVVRWAWGV